MEKFGTGDINLACALMSLGIPPNQHEPCAIIAHEDGSVYSRYYFEPYSIDGKHETIRMSRAWSSMQTLPASHPLHWISDFIMRGEKGFKIADWFSLVIDEYKLKNVSDDLTAKGYIESFPNNPESYCLAFVLNRIELLKIHRQATQKIYMSKGSASIMVDAKLPQYQKRELVNRLNG